MLDILLRWFTHVPQPLYRKEDGRLVLIVAKVKGDLKSAGEADRVEHFVKEFNSRFKFGDVKHGPGNLCFFGINIIPNFYCTI